MFFIGKTEAHPLGAVVFEFVVHDHVVQRFAADVLRRKTDFRVVIFL